MNIFLKILLLCVTTVLSTLHIFAEEEYFFRETSSEVDGIKYYYRVREFKYISQIDHSVTYYVPDDQGVSLCGVRFNGKLEELTLPTRLYNEKYKITVIPCRIEAYMNSNFTVNKLIIPEQYNDFGIVFPDENPDISDPYSCTFSVKEFVCENDTKDGLYSEDGVLFNYNSYYGKELLQLPVLSDRINYHFPADVSWPSSDFFIRLIYNPLLEYPLIFSEETKNLDRYSFYYYPFAGIRIPEKFKNQSFSIASSKLVTFENYKLSTRIPRTLAAVCIPKYDIDSFWKKGLFYLYSDGSVRGNLKYVEFRTDVLPTYSDPDYQYPGGFSNEIVTFVQPHLVDGFKQLQSDGLFPPNALIEPTKDWIYLHPTLDNGKWVNRQSQFIYAACRFGDSEIVEEEWTTDNEEVATVDETGIVTLKEVGEVTVSCTLKDQNGNQSTAERTLIVTQEDLKYEITGVDECSVVESVSYPAGVYNAQGIYLGETIENLPAGVYIVNGKKVIRK